ncbi:hypothetical protein OPIT5_12150 [Opitutaceae bacterium TAV5]|nr:hypothetical protein OPIT5_12150 [Opitutaceae bacterium TAV5]
MRPFPFIPIFKAASCVQIQLIKGAAFFVLATLHLGAAALFEDSFDYSDWDAGPRPMSATWESWQRKPVIEEGADPVYPARYLKLANSIVSTSLRKPVDSDFVLTVQLLSTHYGRLHWFGLSNEDGTDGYFVAWDTGLASQFSSQGRVAIGKIDLKPSERLGYQRPGPFITKPATSGHNSSNTQSAAISPPFATLALKWSNAQKRLTLLVNNIEIASADDVSPGSLSRLLLAGNSAALISSVKLETPIR